MSVAVRPTDAEQDRLLLSGVLEVVGQVGVERDAVARREVVAVGVAEERDRALEDDEGLAEAGLVHRRVARARAGRKRVLGDLGALAGQRRREDLVRVAAAALAGGAPSPHDRDGAVLVEAQQLREPQLGPRRCARPPAASGSSRRAPPG